MKRKYENKIVGYSSFKKYLDSKFSLFERKKA